MRRRQLAMELRRLRRLGGRTINDVAESLECSPAKISRIENGQVIARVQDVRELLDLYGVENDRRELLISLVREARAKPWWYEYRDLLLQNDELLLATEEGASTIWSFEPHIVPGLLQTKRYARMILGTAFDRTDEEVERRVSLRMARQAVLNEKGPDSCRFVIGEAVLRSLVGKTAERQQFDHLIKTAESANICLQVLPFSADPSPGLGFPFSLFRFSNPENETVVFTEGIFGGNMIYQSEIAGKFASVFSHIVSAAMVPDDSLAFIKEVATNQS